MAWDGGVSRGVDATESRETEAHFFLGLAYFNLGRADLAEKHAQLASEGEAAAGLPEIRYLLGLLAAQRGDTRAAANEYRAYLAAKPDSEMAPDIQARIEEWTALDRSSAQAKPVSDLEALKATVKRTLEEVPNYACSIEIERGEMGPRTGRDFQRALARAEREAKTPPEPVFDRSDRLRLDVAMIGGRELFAWPGDGEFTEKPLAELIGFGAASTGDYALHARNLFVEQSIAFRAAGTERIGGQPAERYAFFVPAEESRFAVQENSEPTVVPYGGSVWAAGSQLAAIELLIKAFPPDYAIEWSRTRIEYQEVELGRERFALPRLSDILIRFRSGAQNSLRVSFRGCRSYAAESAITFGGTPAETDVPAAGPVEIHVPPDVSLSVRIEPGIRSGEAMVGDVVQGVLDQPLMWGLETLFPAGARVQGRIRRLDFLTDPAPHHVLGIELTRVESANKFARIFSELVGISGLSGGLDAAISVEGMRAWRNLGDGQAWNAFFKRWDDGQRSSGPAVYYERFIAHVGLLFFHGRTFALETGLSTRWATVKPR